jgi:PAS domain S-box-containing protein
MGDADAMTTTSDLKSQPPGKDREERRQAEQALRESEQIFRLLVEGVRDYAIFMLDTTGHVATWNLGANRIKGYAAEEVIGRHFSIFYPEDAIARGWPDYELKIAKEDGRFEDEGWRLRKDGSRFWANVIITAVYEGDILRGFSKVTRDLTERRRMEEELRLGRDLLELRIQERTAELTHANEELQEHAQKIEQLIGELKLADRRKNEFLATLAHELRNPLSPIRHAVQLLRLTQGDPGGRQQALALIDRQVAQMVRLIDDLLDISRITNGKLALRQERIELAAAVDSALETTRPLLEESGHELTVTLPPEPVYLEADLTRLAQVLVNLLNNAAKYTEKGGRIELTAEARGGEAVISVRDTGIGLAPEQLPQLFESFSQATPALERSSGGLGVGLSLARGLIELHGGSIEAHSAGPGQGSEFTVRLPLLPQAETAPAPSAGDPEEPRSPQRRILVADDNADVAESLSLLLGFLGHEVTTAGDGLEAFEAAAARRPDVALLDIGMPQLNGYEVAQRIRQQPWGQDMVLIAVTGWGQEEDKQRARAAGFDHHLTKPVNLPDLEKLLETAPGTRTTQKKEPSS